MNWLLKTTALTVGIGALAATSPARATAHDPAPVPVEIADRHRPHADIDYAVYVRHSPWGGWRHYATVETFQEAKRLEWRLERQGYHVKIEDRVDRGHDHHWERDRDWERR